MNRQTNLPPSRMGSAVAYSSAAQIFFHQEIATQEDTKKYLNHRTDLPGVYERRPGGPICICKCNQRKGGKSTTTVNTRRTNTTFSKQPHTNPPPTGRQKYNGADGTASRRDAAQMGAGIQIRGDVSADEHNQ